MLEELDDELSEDLVDELSDELEPDESVLDDALLLLELFAESRLSLR